MAEEAGASTGEWVPVTGKKADVWHHFLHHTVNLGHKCKHCGRLFSQRSATTTLNSHIKTSCQVLKSQTLPSPSLSAPGSSSSSSGSSFSVPSTSAGNLPTILPTATREEWSLGRYIALDNVPIYKLNSSFDIREGKMHVNCPFPLHFQNVEGFQAV